MSREKPYLYVDSKGRYNVRVPSAQHNSSGISWGAGVTAGRSIPITDFFIANPRSSVKDINNALARGQNLILTPGIYNIAQTIEVKKADTVVLGMGHATLTAVGGAVPLEIKDAAGIIVAGITIDAGTTLSPVLLRVGKDKGGKPLGAADPITLSDVYFRVGGPHVGKATTALEINADNVLVDHTWVWRADHGVEGFTGGDTQRWNTNTGTNGVIVNGDNVTATGLFVEHFQKYNTLWKGENGRVILYQNELPYDPPTQADWTQPDGTLGYPGYVVDKKVKTHRLDGAGVYVFNQNNPSIVTSQWLRRAADPGRPASPHHDGESGRGHDPERGQRRRWTRDHCGGRRARERHGLPDSVTESALTRSAAGSPARPLSECTRLSPAQQARRSAVGVDNRRVQVEQRGGALCRPTAEAALGADAEAVEHRRSCGDAPLGAFDTVLVVEQAEFDLGALRQRRDPPAARSTPRRRARSAPAGGTSSRCAAKPPRRRG